MQLNREHFPATIFFNFRRGLTQNQGPVFLDDIVNSTEVIVHSKTNLIKVVQNQLLFR